jgi:hypothetical protein
MRSVEALLAQLPDARRCKRKNPAAELDRVVKAHPWFGFGFRAGDRRISYDYAADGRRPSRPGGTLLVTRIVKVKPPGGIVGTNGPAGQAPPATISKLIRQLGGAAADLKTLWVSRHKEAPDPLPFGDLVAATLVDLTDAEPPPAEKESAIGLVQRALGSDRELHAFVALKGNASVILSSTGGGMVYLHYAGRRPTAYLSVGDAIADLAARHGSKIEPSATRFETFNRDNRRLGDGPWVDTPTLRELVVAALAEAAGHS